MSYVDQFGDFMSGDFMSGDFLTGYPVLYIAREQHIRSLQNEDVLSKKDLITCIVIRNRDMNVSEFQNCKACNSE